MLMLPQLGCQATEVNNDQVASEYGVSVAGGSVAHTKNTTYTTLIASTAYDAYGIFVQLFNTGVATTDTSQLTDIAIGAATAEQVIIPNLLSGNAGTSAGAQNAGCMYFFPIFIKAGTRISATMQGAITSDTVGVVVTLLQWPIRGLPVCGRVTAYGANTADSGGVAHTPGTTSWPAPTQIDGAIANPVRYLQIGTSLGTDTAGANARGMLRITKGAGDVVLVSGLLWMESTTLETHSYAMANFVLSHMRWNIPAGSRLAVAARLSTAEARDFVLYGAD